MTRSLRAPSAVRAHRATTLLLLAAGLLFLPACDQKKAAKPVAASAEGPVSQSGLAVNALEAVPAPRPGETGSPDGRLMLQRAGGHASAMGMTGRPGVPAMQPGGPPAEQG
jgi:hypothetical protein